jgi:2OG-Fe(II) oxygenase superfamily
MALAGRTKHERPLLEGLRHAVHGLRAPFTCGGTLVPEKPVTICFPDNTQIAVLRAKNAFEQQRLLRPLVERCTAAGFGIGRKTRYNRAVRDALQIKAEGGTFSVLHFDPAAAGILEQIRRELAPQVPDTLTAELYNLNVYGTGGHFVPHKDTPRGSDMLGTLVLCLPAQFSNGALVVKHHGVFRTYDWGEAIREQTEPTRIHWAAFFGDVDHQIEQVWGGLRVTLTYLIRRGGANIWRSAVLGHQAMNTVVRQELRALLGNRRFLARGGTLAFPCSHLYHQDARFQRKQRPLSRQTVSSLKGRDHIVAAAAMAEGLEVTLYPYMIETCADGTWQLDHFPTEREQAALGDQMNPTDLEDALSVRGSSDDAGDFDVVWVDPPPHFNGQPTMYPEIAEGRASKVDPDLPALTHLHACEYSATGYFGNEGSPVDLYIYAALHIAIPPYGEGARAVTRTKPL